MQEVTGSHQTIQPPAPESTMDLQFTRKFIKIAGFFLKYIFRIRVEGLQHLDFSKPGMIVANQNAGVWGILNVVSVGYAWYEFQDNPPQFVTQGGKIVFTLPIMRDLVKRIVFVPVSLQGMREPLRQGQWIFVTPGANADQFRPIWERNRVRFKKVAWVDHKLVLTEQLGYIGVASEVGCPIYPLAISGTHEMSPVIYECTRIDRWLGLRWLRKGEQWAGFPITLNHLINTAIFLATPFRTSVLAWIMFLLINIYIDIIYLYPIFPFQMKLKFGEPISIPKVEPRQMGHRETHRLYHQLHSDVVNRMNYLHDEIEATRPWSRLLRRLRQIRSLVSIR
jgi:1-acyl-sn-glycerol-3-phosphate acyltransferase